MNREVPLSGTEASKIIFSPDYRFAEVVELWDLPEDVRRRVGLNALLPGYCSPYK